jgi:uncharacterized membrane protein YkvI
MISTALLFVGAIIGAGFATGAEIVTFFAPSGLPAVLIAALVFLALSAFISAIVFLSSSTPKIFAVLYFILFAAMTAGIIAVAGIITGILSLAVSVAVVAVGFDKMAKFNTVIVAAITVILLAICFTALRQPIHQVSGTQPFYMTVLNAVLYGGLNCCMLDEIAAAALRRNSKKSVYLAALSASAIIAVFVFLILSAIRASGTENAAMPILSVSNNPVTFTVILLAILTSQFAALFAIAKKIGAGTVKSTAAIAAAGFVCSFLGFGSIVAVGYPVIGGFICLFLIFSLTRHFVSRHKRPRQTFPR